MDGWNTSFLLGWPIFRGYVSFREIYGLSEILVGEILLGEPRDTAVAWESRAYKQAESVGRLVKDDFTLARRYAMQLFLDLNKMIPI